MTAIRSKGLLLIVAVFVTVVVMGAALVVSIRHPGIAGTPVAAPNAVQMTLSFDRPYVITRVRLTPGQTIHCFPGDESAPPMIATKCELTKGR